MPPMPDDEHQMLVGRLTRVLDEVITDHALGQVRPGVNVSNRVEGWQENYRVPDVAVFLNHTEAVNHNAFWLGGPDFAIEIVSPGDQTRDKLAFYADVKSRELLIVDRDPWRLELYRINGALMKLVATSLTANSTSVNSEQTSLVFRLVEDEARPRIQVTHHGLDREWTI